MAVQLFSGSLDFLALGVLAQAVLALRHLRFGPRKDAFLWLGAVAGAAAFAVLLGAAQWMPALEWLGTTWRSRTPLSTRLMFSVHPLAFLQTVVPFFPFDLPLAPTVRALLADNLEGRDPLLGSLYLGAAALPFVLAALGTAKRKDVVALVVLLGAASALALGRHGIAYFWAVETFPGIGVFRFPAKAMVLVALAFALLAGLGFEAWERLPRPVALFGVTGASLMALGLLVFGQAGMAWVQPWLVRGGMDGPPLELLRGTLGLVRDAGGLAAAAAVVSLAMCLRSRWGSSLPWVALLLVAGDLGLAHRHLVPQAPREWFASAPALIEAARADGVGRLYVFDYRRRAGRAAGPWKPEESPALLALSRAEQVAVLGQEYPPDGSRWGVAGGFETDVAGLESPAHLSLNLLVRYHQEDDETLARLLRLGGVTHLATRHRLAAPSRGPFDLQAEVETPHLGPVFLYRVPRPLPRAYVVEGVRPAAPPAAYTILVDPSFDPQREVVLAASGPRPSTPGFTGEARVVADGPGRVVVDVRLNRPGSLVVLEGYAPGWRARVDGALAPVAAGNAIFLTVPLNAGEHRVELGYRPRSVLIGLAVSGATLVAAALAMWVRRPRAYSSS